MIQQETILDVADNSGAKKVLCINVIGGGKKKYARVGDRIKCVVKKSLPNAQVKKSDVLTAVVVRSVYKIQRDNGVSLRFDDNAVVIINENDGNPRGTRVFGPIPRELRKDYTKIISLANEVI